MAEPTPRTPSNRSDDYALLEEDVLAETTGPAAEKKAGVDALAELFPDAPRGDLARTLASHGGQLDAAASALAAASTVDERSAREAADAALAASLNAEERRRTDRQLARRVAASERAVVERPRSRDAGGGGGFRPTQAVLARAVGVLRDVVVPAVHARIKGMTFSDVSSDGNSGVRYALRDVCVVALSLPADHVTVRAVGGVVQVHLVHVFVSVSAGRFRYESSLLPISDEGALDASVAGLTAVANLRPVRSNADAIRLVVRDVSVHVEGAVRVRARGTAADWAYNAVAALCKPLVVSYVKDTVATTLRTALQRELRDFQYVPDAEPSPTVVGATLPSQEPSAAASAALGDAAAAS